ncbi:MAG: FISUMP domain-containing protein [Bacteroidales bacterium]|nr:FISUMP domain-containing protein [Bacteroidales bacterium]
MIKLYILILVLVLNNIAYSQNYYLNFFSGSDTLDIQSISVRNLSNDSIIVVNADDVVHLLAPDDLKFSYISQNDFSVFPNPTSGEFYVNISIPNAGNVLVELFDISGKRIYNTQFYAEEAIYKLKFQGVLSGIYFIVIKSDSFVFSEKILGVQNGISNIRMEVLETMVASEEDILEKSKEIYFIPYNFGDVLLMTAISENGNKTNKAILLTDDGSLADGDNFNIFFNFYNCKDYEQNEYAVVEIADKVWMAENINSVVFADGQSIKQITSDNTWQQLSTVAYCDYDNLSSESEGYGRLYNWYAVHYSGGICPHGWHVATDAEWLELENYLGISTTAINSTGWRSDSDACVLKESGTSHWLNDPGEFTNLTGFTALPAGIRDLAGVFRYRNKYSAWWTATESNQHNAWCRALRTDSCDIYREDGKKTLGLSVRCVYDDQADTIHHQVYLPIVETSDVINILMNSAQSGGTILDDGGDEITAIGIVWSTMMNPDIDINEGITIETSGAISFNSVLSGLFPNMTYYVRAYATNSAGTSYGNILSFTTLESFFSPGAGVADIDGNLYQTVLIAGREFMAENLRTSRYNNGDTINRISDSDSWALSGSGSYCWFEDDSTAYEELYGKLYNFMSIINGNICPSGWHVPSDDEWAELETYLGMDNLALYESGWRGENQGGMLKQTGLENWLSPNAGATNQSGFTALPAGYRGVDGVFQDLASSTYFWSMCQTGYSSNVWIRALNNTEKGVLRDTVEFFKGASIRCVKSIFTLPDVTTNEVTDITISTAQCGGNIIFNGWDEIIQKGVVWNRTGNPTIDDNEGISVDGSGDDAFSSFITGLEPSSIYYVRAYAINSEGVAYGEEKIFNTLTALFIPGPGVIDFNGNHYKTIVLGSREWMAENLRVTNSIIGPISNIESDDDWQAISIEAYCWYDNDSASYDSIYGKMYNFTAVNGEGICPDGWIIPSDWEWIELEMALGIESDEANLMGWRGLDQGGKMKAPGTEFWNYPNLGATNEFGFSAFPGGYRSDDGSFIDMGVSANFWMYDTDFNEPYWPYSRHFKNDSVKIGRAVNNPQKGFYVRCVKMQYFATVVTKQVTNILDGNADSGGDVILEGFYGVSSAGIVWADFEYPTIETNTGMTFDSSGLGEFNSTMSGLVPGTVYYVRAYATNKDGTSYGNQYVFTAE